MRAKPCQEAHMKIPKAQPPAAVAVTSPTASTASVQSVGVAFAVVEELANAADPLGVSELARRLGHTKARVHRHLVTLRELGFVEQEAASDRYRLGWKLFRLGMALAENFDLRRLARPHLLRLHDQIGQTVVLAMPAGGEITVVDAVQSRNDVAITVRPGSLLASTSSAMGRVILAFREVADVAAALAVPAAAASAVTKRDRREVEARLPLIRERWYEVAVNERLPGVSAMAAPIFDESDQIAGSIGIVAPASVLRDPPDPALAAHLQQAAVALSSELRSTRWQQSGPGTLSPAVRRSGKAVRR
jgi:IclR family KDG regulon transcriptional repressor